MKRRLLTVLLALVALSACAGQLAAQTPAAAGNGLVPPPTINIPYGGRIVTEINISDADLLAVIKEIIPQIGEIVAGMKGMPRIGAQEAMGMQVASGLDFAALAKAISGITNVRVIAALYGSSPDRETMLAQLDAGVTKTGKFTRIMADVAMSQGLFAVYAQAENGGYVAFALDPNARVLYAVRVVGFVDLPNITKWAFQAAKLFVGSIGVTAPEQPAAEPDAAPEAAPTPN